MQRSTQKMYADLVGGKSVKAILSDCLLRHCQSTPSGLFASQQFNSALKTARDELNQNSVSDHDAILQALLKLSALPATFLDGVLSDFLTVFPIYRPLFSFSVKAPSPFEIFTQTALDLFCWDKNYWQAAESFAAFRKYFTIADQDVHKKRFLVGLSNAKSDQVFRRLLLLLPHFVPAFDSNERKAFCAFLLLNFGQKSLLLREQIILSVGLCARQLPSQDFISITHFLSLHLTGETSHPRIQIAAFTALMQNIDRLEAQDHLIKLQLAWLTKPDLRYQVIAFENLPALSKLTLSVDLCETLFKKLYNALAASNEIVFAASLNAFSKLTKLFDEKVRLNYLRRVLELYDTFSDKQKALFFTALPLLHSPSSLDKKLAKLIEDYVKEHEAPWLYPAVALFHKTTASYTHYWKLAFSKASTDRKIADCQLFSALAASINAIAFITVLDTLEMELQEKPAISLVICIAETLVACKGRLNNQKINAFLTLLFPYLHLPAAEEALSSAVVTLLRGSEPPECYQAMAILHNIGTKSTLHAFLELQVLQDSFQLEQVLPASPRQRYSSQ